MKRFRWFLPLLLVWNGLALGAQGDVEIQQKPIECWPVDQFLLIQSSFVPPEEIQTAKFYFRSAAQPDYYYIELTLGQSGGSAIAPKAQPDTVEVTFYTELVTHSFSAFRTEERTVPVASGAECKRRDPETAYYNGQNPDIAVGATRAGATPMPPGFQANGISRFINVIGTEGATAGGGISAKTIGIIGGAGGAGAALLLLGGGSDATTTGPVGGITTSSPSSSSTSTAIGGVTSTTTTVGGGGTSTSSTTTTIGGGSTTTIFGSTTTVVGGSTTTVIGSSTTTVVGSSTTTSVGTSSTTTVIGSSTTTSVVGSSTTTSVGTSTTTSAPSTTTSVGTSTTTRPSTTTSVGTSTTTSAPSTTTSAGSSTTTSTPSTTTSAPSTTTRPTTTTTAGAAQLTISKSASPNPVVVRTTLTYTVSIRNVGSANATGVTMEDTLPGSVNVTFINNPNCRDFGGGDIRCFSLSIPAGQTINIVIRVIPQSIGTITNRAAITAGPNFPSTSVNTNVVTSLQAGDRPEPVVVKTFLDIEPYNGRSRGRVVFNGSEALEITNTSPIVHHVLSRPGENRVEATMLAGEARRRGFWRFDFAGAPRFVPGSLQVDAGQVYAQDGRSITFAVGEGSSVRFRYQVAEADGLTP